LTSGAFAPVRPSVSLCACLNVTSSPWTKAGTTGPNGTVLIEGIIVTFTCPTLGITCKYEGAGPGGRVTGDFYNANDTNKPKASTASSIS
jgi:hypothetical protein